MELKRLFPLPSNKVATVDLFCLPCAGGSTTTYRSWDEEFPEWIRVIPIELPGRNGRFEEGFPASASELTATLARAIGAIADRPYAIFGHSMGALLAFYLAAELSSIPGSPRPEVVLLSGRRGPNVTHQGRVNDFRCRAELIKTIKLYDGVPPEVLDDPDLAEVFLPIFQRDFALLEQLTALEPRTLPCPLAAMCGEFEPDFNTDALNEWKSFTSQWMGSKCFSGGHFYFLSLSTRAQLIAHLEATIQECLAHKEARADPIGHQPCASQDVSRWKIDRSIT